MLTNLKKLLLFLTMLALTIPVVTFAQGFNDVSSVTDVQTLSETVETETIDVGKGLTIMPNLQTEVEYVLGDQEIESVKEPLFRARTFSLLSTPNLKLGTFTGSGNNTVNIYKNATTTSAYTYVSDGKSYSGVVAVIDETENRYQIALAGIVGWIDKTTKFKTSDFSTNANYNYYTRNSENELVHYIKYDATDTTNRYGSGALVQGKAPDYIQANTLYLSFDGHYFYENSVAGYTHLVSDYKAGIRTHSVNPDAPYYNYFQWLPARAQTKLTATDLRNYLVRANYNNTYKSRMYEMEQLFIDYGNLYGGNAALAFSTGVHESAYGGANFAVNRNNFFGHSAYDSSPGSASTYASPGLAIERHFSTFWNWNYIDGDPGNNPLYFGGFVGNKALGMNVKYASDPYWGEKIANHYYAMDKLAGFKDYGRYTIGIVNSHSARTRNTASIANDSNVVYTVKYYGIPVLITDTITGQAVGSDNNTTWYRITSEHLLGSNKKLLPWKTDGSNRRAQFNINNSQIYISATLVDVVFTGTDSTLLTQTNPTMKETPGFESTQTTVYTLSNLNLRPDWSTDYSAILTIPKDTKLTGYKTNNGWFQVIYNDGNRNYIGYLSLDHLSLTKGGIAIGGNSGGGDLPDPDPKPDPEPTPNFKVGDLNKDNRLTIGDLRIIHQHLTGKKTMTSEQIGLADLNGDNRITIGDLRVIHQHLTGKELINGW